ncbi:penicillin-binding protein [Desulfoluna limicola]|uniref:Penicillin-binding protein 1A n=1 Tax=Desulfoluna limicola TaxID=2810562 RepID=A0ABM7PL64_9BACT|nr:PBP1A family penicillin-binding protein [Desulfoluna limicola]BCS97831.1 penicillin-binding protein [Desulfoluna limicola]
MPASSDHQDPKSDQSRQKTPPKKERRLLRLLFKMMLWGFCLAMVAGISIYLYFSADLPKITSLRDYRPPTVTVVTSDDGRKIGEFFRERRIVIPLSDMPDQLLQAFVSAEDARFYKHRGIDLFSIIRAFTKNLKAGTIVQGGSTITQQVTKSFFLSPERSYDRKIKEAILAYRLDRSFAKNEVLYLYLNQIYLGHGAYGVEAAAENYFGKKARDLNLAECAILAGLPQAPSRYSPFRYKDKAKQRQIYVLNRMVEEGYITNIEATEAINTPLDIKPRRNWYIEKVPCYTEYVRRYVEKKYGADALYEGGLKIQTAVNIEMQKIARKAITQGLEAMDRRQGYRGPLGHLAPSEVEKASTDIAKEMEGKNITDGTTLKGVVEMVDNENGEVLVRCGNRRGVIPLSQMRWARKPDITKGYWEDRIQMPGDALSVGDLILVRVAGHYEGKREWTKSGSSVETLELLSKDALWSLALHQEPISEAALLSIEADTGYVKSMIGGRDFLNSQFNRAIQSRRQPGSAYKPIVYAAAIDKGYTPATVIIDSPVVYLDEDRDFTWKPNNYERTFHGATLLREALTKSMNIITIKILKEIGVDYVIDYSRRLGITAPINKDLSIALGSSGVSLLEMVRSYSVFANLGYLVEPTFITRIEDRDGNVLEEAIPIKNQAIEPSTAYLMTSLLKSVVEEGTGRRVRKLGRPAAGKTGTTNNLYDAWFMGYTPTYVTGVWVGNDQKAPLGKSETGSRAASPIWLDYMKGILAKKPVKVFEVPEGVVFAKIDAKTGLLPGPDTKKTLFECFKEGTVPTEQSQPLTREANRDELFKENL